MKRLTACLLALVLLLSGCTEGSYVSVKPHQGENTSRQCPGGGSG